MCVCCFGCVPSHTSQRRRSFGRPEDASSARRSFCIAQAPPADTRRVEPSKASTRSSNRSSTRSSSVTSAAARAGRGPTSRGARTRCPGRPRARRRPWTTGDALGRVAVRGPLGAAGARLERRRIVSKLPNDAVASCARASAPATPLAPLCVFRAMRHGFSKLSTPAAHLGPPKRTSRALPCSKSWATLD